MSDAPLPTWKTDQYLKPDDPLVLQNLEEWQKCRFGLMIHWGPYCQWEVVESWSICSEDLPWCSRESENYENYKRDYQLLKNSFNPVQFDPEKIADTAYEAGMRYLVFTAKHHDGFCMFETSTTNYKITDPTCPYSENKNANITLKLFDAFRARGFKIGIYFSKPDWNSPWYWPPRWATPDRNVNYSIEKHPDLWDKFVSFTHSQINELTRNFGKIDILWLDGEWVRATPSKCPETGFTRQIQDIQMDRLAQIARKNQPGILIVDRWVHGNYENYLTPEQLIPDENPNAPWESCVTIGDSWSYQSNDKIKSSHALIRMYKQVSSNGGNFLLNVPLNKDGEFHPIAVSRLKEIGAWFKANPQC